MGVDLFSLNVKLGATGTGAVLSDLRAVDAQGVKTAASLNGIAGSLDRGASAALNGTKGFKDLSGAYANQERVLAQLGPATVVTANATEEHAAKTKKATEAAKEHGETLHGLWGTLKQLAGAYFLFEGLHFVGEAVEQAAALHELSQKTGATVETLSVLAFAAKRADVSMDQVSIGFKGMAISLGNLRDGQEKTVAAYQRLGFTAESFKGLNPEQTFLKLAVAVGAVKDETERAEIAQRVFGRAGSQLVPLLEDLATNGFAKTREEAEKFNAVISGETADAADKVKDDWHDIQNIFTSLARLSIPLLADAMRSLNQVLRAGPGDTWRNTMREIAGAVDGATRLATLGFFGTHLSDKYLRSPDEIAARGKKDPGGFRGDGLGMGTNPNDPIGDAAKAAPLSKEEIAAARKAYVARVLGLANMDEAMKAPDKLDHKGVAATHLDVRGGGVSVSPVGIPGGGSAGDDFMGGSLEGDLSGLFAQGGDGSSAAGRQSILAAFANEAKRGAVALKVQFATLGQGLGLTLANGFANALSAAMSGKNPFKAFGNVVLAGLGGIMQQMGGAMIRQGLILIKLLPFLSSPFTSGPALLAAGIALTALGGTLGGIMHGNGGGSGGGGGGSDFGDRTTNITLTAAGMGGNSAPAGQPTNHYHVIGIDSPQGTTLLGKGMAAAKRMNKA